MGTLSFIAATLLYVLIIVGMNYWNIKKHLQCSIDWKNVIVMPLVSAVIMGVVALSVYFIFTFILSNAFGEYIRSGIAVIAAIIIAAITYFVSLLRFGGYTEEMLLAFPKGAAVARIAKKFHIIKE